MTFKRSGNEILICFLINVKVRQKLNISVTKTSDLNWNFENLFDRFCRSVVWVSNGDGVDRVDGGGDRVEELLLDVRGHDLRHGVLQLLKQIKQIVYLFVLCYYITF